MANYFPRQTIELSSIPEPGSFRKLSWSLTEMAVVTGVLIRLLRSLAMGHFSTSLIYWFVMIGLGFAFLVSMATAHLSNFTLRRWVWRAPVFALVEAAAESVVSLLLIWLHREPNGSVRATFADWPSMVAGTVVTRVLVVVIWALILAGAVTLARRTVVQQEAQADEPLPPVPAFRPSQQARATSGATDLE